MIRRGLAVVDQAVTQQAGMSNGGCWERHRGAHLLLASLTLILGRARSSLSLWLCSDSLRSLSSDMDCLCGRFMMYFGGYVQDLGKRARDNEPEEEEDDAAGETARALRCGRCKLVSYCSPEHQKCDWEEHKRLCVKNTC